MRHLNQILRHPLFIALVLPTSSMLFGFITGLHAGAFDGISALQLYLIVICSQLISHHFFVQYDLRRKATLPKAIFLAVEILLFLVTLYFIMTHHWALNMVLIMYVVFIHVQYFPYNLTNTPYHFGLSIFFYGIVLNSIAHFTQAKYLSSAFILTLIPLVIVQYALQNEILKQKELLMRIRPSIWVLQRPILSVIIASIGLLVGAYMSLPSHSFYFMQAVFLIVCGVSYLPLVIQTNRETQKQNKLQYLNTVFFIFSILYGLSYIF